MMRVLLSVVVVLNLLEIVAVLGNKIKVECEKRCHSSLSATQRTNLCNQEEYSLGPAACSVMAKEALHLKYEDIYRLCREAPSAAPVECMLKLDSRDRAEAGYSICSKAASSLPSECFQRVMSHATKVSRKAVAEFCHGVVDYAPILCTEAARDHTTMKVEDILPICKDAVGSGNSSASNTQNHLVANCIATLKHLVSNANGVAAKDVLEFCVHINPNQYHDFIDVNEFSLASVNCVEQLSQKRKSMTLKLTQKNIFSICLNAPTALGPVNCSISVAEAISVKEPSLKLTSDAIATLCRSAVGTGPVECFVESRGLGSQDERAHLCHSAVNSVKSEFFPHFLESFLILYCTLIGSCALLQTVRIVFKTASRGAIYTLCCC